MVARKDESLVEKKVCQWAGWKDDKWVANSALKWAATKVLHLAVLKEEQWVDQTGVHLVVYLAWRWVDEKGGSLADLMDNVKVVQKDDSWAANLAVRMDTLSVGWRVCHLV